MIIEGDKMILNIIVISVIGTIGHFLYEFSNHNKVVALFAAVNESLWEHIKIALTPTFLWAIYDGFEYGGNPNYFIAKFISLISVIIFIPLIYYLYTLMIKKHILFIDIIIFYLSIVISQILFKYFINLQGLDFIYQYLSCIGIFVIFGIYMSATLLPIKTEIFKDPITNKYGIKGHSHFDH